MSHGKAWRRASLGAIRHDLDVTQKFLEEASKNVRRLRRDLEEAQDAGLLSLRSNTGGSIPAKGTASNPTQASAANYEFIRLQQVNKHVAIQVQKAERGASATVRGLERAITALHGAWLDTDPDIGPDRRRRRREAAEAAAAASKEGAA